MAERILKLEASAGSGKTHLLTRQFLARLFQAVPERPAASAEEVEMMQRRVGSILAITFTNKAAGEMKERILTSLKRFAMAHRGAPLPPESRQLLQEITDMTRLPAASILAQADRLVEIILAGYDEFHVRTIDSLMSNVIKVISPDLHLPPDYRIKVDARDALQQSLFEFLAAEAAGNWDSLEAFLQEYASLQGLKKWNLHEEIAETINKLYRLYLNHPAPQAEEGSVLAESIKAAFQNRLSPLRRNLEGLLALVREEPARNGCRIHFNRTRFTQARLQGLESFVHQGEEKDLAGLVFLAGAAPESFLNKNCPVETRDLFARLLSPIQDDMEEAFHLLGRYRIIRFHDFYARFSEQWNLLRRTLFVEEFSKTIHEQIQVWAASALPYLYLKLSDRYLHFLFDEFQDTSELQFKTLAPIVDEVLSSQKSATLFIVGDRKQAIYRWRGGNSRLMDEEVLKVEMPALKYVPSSAFTHTQRGNWRSGREIIGFNNAFWSPESIAQAVSGDMLRDAARRNFATAVQEIPEACQDKKGYVRVELRRESRQPQEETDEPEERLQTLFTLVKSHIEKCLHIGFTPGEIAVLMRRNEDCRKLLAFLADTGIPAVSDESLLLSLNPLASEILAAFRFLDYPPDDLSFYAFICGDIFRRRTLELFPGEMAAFNDRLFFTSSRRPLYLLFRERFPNTWKSLIEPFFQAVGFLPPYDLFADLCMRFRVFENFPENSAFFISFADLLHHQEQENLQSLAAFLARWDELAAGSRAYAVESPETPSAVRIMTIHQAKGLGFPAVILSLIPSGNPRGSHFFLDEKQLFWITREYRAGSRRLRTLYEQGQVQEAIDELNLLYVALTRAEKALFITGSARPEPREESESRDLNSLASVFFSHPLFASQKKDKIFWEDGALPAREKGVEGVVPTKYSRVFCKSLATSQWQREYLVFIPSPIRSQEEKAGIQRGEAMHRILARLGFFASPEQLLEALFEAGPQERLDEGDIQLLGRFLCRPDVFRFFSGAGHFHVEKEWSRSCLGQVETRRIDRLIVENEVLVVEFKTGKAKSADHINQVQEYLMGIAPLFPGKRVTGFLLYIDIGDSEEVRC